MRIIDCYLLRQFLWTFLVCFLSLAGLYIVFDAFTNLEEFLRIAKKPGDLLGLLASHYSYQGILFFDRTSGLLTLIAAMFTMSWIQRHNEMIALLSAGISRVRIVAPVVVAAILVTSLATANRELVMPTLREQLAKRPKDLAGDRGQAVTPCNDAKTEILIRGKATYADENRIDEPNFLMPLSLSHYGTLLAAESAFYRPAENDRPGGYLLDNVRKPARIAERSSLMLGGEPVVITPLDAPDWLQPNQCFVVSEVTFEQVTRGSSWRQFASTAELIAGLRSRSVDFGANVRVAIHVRLVQPLLDITLLFLGLPLVLGRESRNVFIAIGLCALVVAGFMLVVITFQHLGCICALSPSLAAWAPLFFFVPVAVGMSQVISR